MSACLSSHTIVCAAGSQRLARPTKREASWLCAGAPLGASGGDGAALALSRSLQLRFLDARQLGRGLLRPPLLSLWRWGALWAGLLGGVARRPLLLGRRRRLAGTGALQARRRRASDLHEFARHPREVLEQLAARVPDCFGVAL